MLLWIGRTVFTRPQKAWREACIHDEKCTQVNTDKSGDYINCLEVGIWAGP